MGTKCHQKNQRCIFTHQLSVQLSDLLRLTGQIPQLGTQFLSENATSDDPEKNGLSQVIPEKHSAPGLLMAGLCLTRGRGYLLPSDSASKAPLACGTQSVINQ